MIPHHAVCLKAQIMCVPASVCINYIISMATYINVTAIRMQDNTNIVGCRCTKRGGT